MPLQRHLLPTLLSILAKGKSVLLLGPRQTGKTTLIQDISADKRVNLANLKDRLRYEKSPATLATEIEYLHEQSNGKVPLIIIDEIQKIPLLMDAVQDLIDRKIAQFIITGSSARKLRRSKEVNLLPGRVIALRLDPLMQDEITFPYSLEDRILDGSLPEVALHSNVDDREALLDAYVSIYLEEEIRAEAMVRNLGSFARFLEFAASESGQIVNAQKLSQEIGVSHATITSYYQILEDCLIVERIEPITESKTRYKLMKAQKYLFYDLGVRRVAAREGRALPLAHIGFLFEQYIGLELIRLLRTAAPRASLKYWRDPSGPEIDFVIDIEGRYIPIEVKWTERPSISDAKHLNTFLAEYPTAEKAYVICQTPHPMKINDKVTALSWQSLAQILWL